MARAFMCKHRHEPGRRAGEMLKRYFRFCSIVILLLLAMPSVLRAQFGGSSIVFDPQMFARQLLQLQQETAAVTNLAQQLQYMVKNTTGGGAGVWQSNSESARQFGRTYFRAAGPFLHLPGPRATIPAALSRLQRHQHARRAKPAGKRRYHAEHLERRAPERAVAGPELPGRAGRAANPRGEESDRDRQSASGTDRQ